MTCASAAGGAAAAAPPRPGAAPRPRAPGGGGGGGTRPAPVTHTLPLPSTAILPGDCGHVKPVPAGAFPASPNCDTSLPVWSNSITNGAATQHTLEDGGFAIIPF